MYKKSFISLSFYSDKLQMIKLDPKRQKVEKYGSFPIPAGLIKNHRVQNTVQLAKIIKAAIGKLQVKEKSVGVVVPEFSTYTKSLKLPLIEIEEVDEAVRWQANEFLPTNPTDMVMDWRINNQDDDNYLIMAVAIRRDILGGYIDAVGKAGFLPLVVETPSLSLSRLSDDKDNAKIIMYVNPEETVILVGLGHNIYGSSVVSSKSQSEIIATAQRLLAYYTSLKVTEFFLGGQGLSQAFINNLQNALKIKVKLLNFKVGGLTPVQIQEYLIPLSLQLKDPVHPESEDTINLLPPAWVKHYKKKLFDYQAWTLTLVSSISIWTVFLGVFIVFMVFSRQIAGLKLELSSGLSSKFEEIYTQVKDVNDMSSGVITIKKDQKSPQDIINLVNSVKSGEVRILVYDMNFEKGEVTLDGIANTRQSLVTFKQALEAKNETTDVELPVTNLESDTNSEFSLTLSFGAEKIEKDVPKLQI